MHLKANCQVSSFSSEKTFSSICNERDWSSSSTILEFTVEKIGRKKSLFSIFNLKFEIDLCLIALYVQLIFSPIVQRNFRIGLLFPCGKTWRGKERGGRTQRGFLQMQMSMNWNWCIDFRLFWQNASVVPLQSEAGRLASKAAADAVAVMQFSAAKQSFSSSRGAAPLPFHPHKYPLHFSNRARADVGVNAF